MRLDKQSLQFSLHETGRTTDLLEAYERLIYDAMCGDHTLFTSAEGIERLWERSKPLLENPPPVRPYPPGSWGPERDPPADRAGRVASAVRTGLAENCVTAVARARVSRSPQPSTMPPTVAGCLERVAAEATTELRALAAEHAPVALPTGHDPRVQHPDVEQQGLVPTGRRALRRGVGFAADDVSRPSCTRPPLALCWCQWSLSPAKPGGGPPGCHTR